MRNLVLVVVSVIGLFVLAPKSASAASAAGTWKSTSGNTFVIPDSKTEFDVVRQGPDGARELMKARWVEGMTGTQFTYRSNGVTCTATFNQRDPDMLRVVCGNQQPSVWTRVAEQKTGRGLVGTWYSTTGNMFTIPEKSRDEFDIVVKLTNGQKALYKARWVDGMVGTQFTYSAQPGQKPNTGTRNGENRDQIRIVDATGKVSIWYREGTKRN
jgi:hypothetical protein